MRPLLLKIKGFTSFRDEQELDFTDLDLFAICGPTGSGKSSLLDAMTFALFGYVERVGKQVVQLLSQGQPRLAVEFHFAVGDARYRVTRTIPRSGSAKARLERLEGDEWISDGEGADRVNEVNKRIVRLIGLDYDAFTRAVFLPQGKFAEFLVGDPSKRREILTELLGLSLFKQMAQRANEIAKEAKQKAETTAELLEREYEGVSDEALEKAQAEKKAAAEREAALTQAGASVQGIAERWAAAGQAVRTLRALASDAADVSAVLAKGSSAIAEHAARLAVLAKDEAARQKLAAKAKDAAGAAVRARSDAETTFGPLTTLIELRAQAQSIEAARADADALVRELEKAQAREPALAKAFAAAEAALTRATDAFDGADRALEEARESYRQLERRDALAAACEGLHAGDACPLCGATMTQDPPQLSDELAKAKAAGVKLKAARDAAEAKARDAQRARDSAERDVVELGKEVARLTAQAEAKRAAVASAEQTVAAAFGGTMPNDPVWTLTERITTLESLVRAERDAATALQEAEDSVREAERTLAKANAAIAEERARLSAQPLPSIAARARDASPDAPVELSPPPDGDDLDAFGAWAREAEATTRALSARLTAEADRTASGERALLAEAMEIVGDLLPPAPNLESLIGSLAAAVRQAAADRATADAKVETLLDRLAKRVEMKASVDALDLRAERFRQLGLELRADRLVAFLQSEALQVLCAAGTQHLLRLSNGRYRLECEDDEFQVVDTWNGDETRSVKTLSGGETFMASLSLALALSEQQPSLAVERTARIDSLFLDEGFGTLDPESLEEVVQAIEQLGGDGRMVGVITHVAELADRLPTKVVVEKSPRGSRVSIVT